MNLKICKQTKDNFFLSPDVNNHCTKIRRCAVELNPFNNETPHFVPFLCFGVSSLVTLKIVSSEMNKRRNKDAHAILFYVIYFHPHLFSFCSIHQNLTSDSAPHVSLCSSVGRVSDR